MEKTTTRVLLTEETIPVFIEKFGNDYEFWVTFLAKDLEHGIKTYTNVEVKARPWWKFWGKR